MKKFLVLYKASIEAIKQMNSGTQEERKESMGKWFAWKEQAGSSLLDFGAAIKPGEEIKESGSSTDTSTIGYSFIQVEDMTAAKKVLDNHPHLGWHPGVSIIVHEVMPMPE